MLHRQHEYNDADNSWRYINETWGPTYGQENSVGEVTPGLGRIVVLHHRASTSYQVP